MHFLSLDIIYQYDLIVIWLENIDNESQEIKNYIDEIKANLNSK